MGKSNLPLLDRSSRYFNAIERDSLSTHTHGFSFLRAKFRLKPWASIKQTQTTVAHTTCRYCSVRSYALVRQPFLKWLYTLSPPQRPICVTRRVGREKRKRANISLEGGNSSGNSLWKIQIICKRRIIFIVPIAYVTFLLDFLLSLTICDGIIKDVMYSVKFLTNLGNSLIPCLFLAS